MPGIRVLIVDDHALFAEALAARLGAEADLEMVPVATDLRRAAMYLATERPDVAVVDLNLGGDSGLDLLDRIRSDHPATKAVMLTAERGVEPLVEAVRRGAVAWLAKSTDAEELARVIRGVARGEGWIPPELLPEVLRLLTDDPAEPEPNPLAVLTPREREVLQCMVDGHSRPEIAEHLGMSVNTVRTHTQNLMSKLEVRSAVEAITLAMRSGIQPTPSP